MQESSQMDSGKDNSRSFGEMPTFGREEPDSESSEQGVPSWYTPELAEAATLKSERTEGIVDDGRTDAVRRWTPGEVILGRYMVERELGQGGMGVVYGCLDRVGGVRVAVKCLPPELAHDSMEMEEVRENFRLVYGLSHPNIAGVRQLERDARGEYFLVMEVAEGESLRKWERAKWKAGGVGLSEAVAVLRQVAAALDYAHSEKVVHRDVKPGNVMIDGKGRIKVLDFGLADQIRTSLSRASQTYRGTSGTGPYMSPEQWRGRPQDGKTDQYALGVMAYEMLAGRLPFENADMSVLREVVLNEEPEAIPDVPEGAMDAIRRAMAKARGDRFASCGEFVEALEAERAAWKLEKAEVEKVQNQALEAFQEQEARGRTSRWVGFLAVVLIVAVEAGAVWWKGEKERFWKNARSTSAELERPQAQWEQQLTDLERQGVETARQRVEANKEAQPQQSVQSPARTESGEGGASRPGEPERAEKPEWVAPLPKEEPVAATRTVEPHPAATVPQTGTSAELGRGAYAGETKTIRLPGNATMEMVWCPSGSFTMGSNNKTDAEKPPHEVTLTKGFWMAKTEVTQGQWEKVMGTTVRQQHDAAYGAEDMFFQIAGEGDDYPMYYVDWDEVQEFCRRAGNGLSLPTEAEWEYACRTGTVGDYAERNDQMAWPGEGDDGSTHPVGQKKANAWGLYDMYGNVAEWCEDWFDSEYYAHSPKVNPKGPASGVFRVLRGGSYALDYTVSTRYANYPHRHLMDYGFRPVVRQD